MRIGPMRFLATVKKLEKTQDSLGGKVENWAEFGKAWVDLQTIKGNERYIAHEKYSEATHKVFMRYLPGLTPQMQIEINGKQYEIEAVDNLQMRNKTHMLIVKEVLNG